ncbi:MAG TPA: response regulator [Acidobacteriaceae bacterium]|nr:response regulator [Acidobacteriaceae bacterium]
MSSEQDSTDVQVYSGPVTTVAMGGHNGDSDSSQDGGFSSPHGMGQSKSSRRRRRKRKGKTEGGPQAGPGGQPVGDIQASAAPSSQPQNQQNGAGQQQQGAPATKRWKKKFRDRERPRGPENPGNQASSGGYSNNGGGGGYRDKDTHQPGNSVGGFKRKGGGGGGGKQRDRGPRSFVGPMDHSYRATTGNFADTPPSTIQTNGNFGGRGGGGRSYVSDSQPIDYSQGRTIPVAEDAPTKIFFFIEDLFFNAKITETARKLGVKVAFIKNEKEAIAELTSGEEADRPGLIVFDLNNANAKPLTLIPKLKTKLKKSTSIIGFLSHLQGDLKAKAVEAGCDTVMPRAAFSQNLPNLLRRYGLHDEEEDNFNQ